MRKAAVITISDRASRGERQDTSGPTLCRLLEGMGWATAHTAVIPDEPEKIQAELLKCADELRLPLVLTTGGTGFSPRDVTPEATLAVLEREARGIPEAMRAASMKITPMGCLSRAVAGIRGATLIINLPGSEKAACECFSAVSAAIQHGTEMLEGKTEDCAGRFRPEGPDGQRAGTGKILALCVSERRGEQKRPVDRAVLRAHHGIVGDAHAGNWDRQVSLLGAESVAKLQSRVQEKLLPGAFAENVLTDGLCLYELPVGTRLKIGTALCEVTQIGKECHGDCAIRKAAGDCVMPREGIFAKVLESGEARPGDPLIVSVPRSGGD
ncbi:MAG: MOSC domain-containing protein [Fretibacterium sp.]|nr:MOSC domain-containing protein [Fretibacterium sp.]